MGDAAESYNLKVLSEPFVAGDWAYFTVTWIEEDEYRSRISRFNGKTVEDVTFGGREKLPRVHGGKLYFVSYTKEEESLMVVEGMKEPRKLCTSGSISKYVFHKDGILVLAREKGDATKPLVTERLKYRFDTKGYLRARTRLMLIGDDEEELVGGDFDVTDVASNGKRIVFSATIEDDDRGLSDLYEFNTESGKYSRITEGTGEVSCITISQKGEIAYAGHRKGVSPWGTMDLMFPETGKTVKVGASAESSVNSDLFVGPSSSLVSDSGKYYVVGQDGGESFIYECEGDSAVPVTGRGRSVRAFHASVGKIAYIYTTPERPSVLVFGEEYNPNPRVTGRVPVHFQTGGKDAWLMLSSKDRPTILAVHGGPQTAYGYGYSIEFNFLVDNGFNVLYGNPRGSSGYGEEFARACQGDWGGGDFQDLLAFMDEAVSKFGLKDEFAITGGSYGGYMTNNAIVKTDRFKCAISERCVSNLMSMCGTSDIGFWFNAIEAGVEDPWSEDGMRRLLELSPVSLARNVKTPTMFIHGEEDYRCPIEQSEQMYTAIKMNGTESVLARYPGDSHEHARRGVPPNMKDRLERKLKWFRDHMD